MISCPQMKWLYADSTSTTIVNSTKSSILKLERHKSNISYHYIWYEVPFIIQLRTNKPYRRFIHSTSIYTDILYYQKDVR